MQGLSVAPPAMPASSNSAAIDPAQVATALGLGGQSPVGVESSPLSDWRLLGVLRQGQSGAALIAAGPSGMAKTYGVGATVMDGWTVKTVESRKVVLSRSGQDSVLVLLSPQQASMPSGYPARDVGMQGAMQPPPSAPMNAVQSPNGAPIMSSERVGTQDSVSPPRTGN
ncbi:hypothetical protein KIK84_02355 [Curvibacter sp. CHRR-16]|uniref:SctD/MshK family protein n=1 Tax=Curvibacter sp. CHRR-16 TaxID=2835872 RepID=UPI001BDB256A|nr:hypothetical protein [Curvibacter sp. CHRR-16]MBT0569157.1 hypothetical protein [Curvibacter sp. CHRR-16]